MNIKTLGFANAGHSGAQDSSVTQASSQAPLRIIMTTIEAGEIKSAYFSSIISFFKNN